MAHIAYAGDGKSLFDSFFLGHLSRANSVCLLTFQEEPYQAPQDVQIIRIREPFSPSVSPLKGLYAYGASFLRSVLLKKQLNSIKPDVLISSGAVSYGFYSALSNYSPNILLVWGSDVLTAPKLFPFRFMVKYALKKADAVVADSDAEENACVALGYDRRKVVKFPWIDLQPILSILEKDAVVQGKIKKGFKESMGWQKDDLIIISTRHHEPVYDVQSLIFAVPHVVKEVKNARFLILSSGSLAEELKKRVVELGIENHVRFLGRVPHGDIPKYLQMVDIYVSTSLSDGTSASLLEAMACKLPSVVTKIQANQEWIENGRNGLLVETGNPQALAEGLISLLRNDSLRKAFAGEAFKTLMEKADWDKNSRILDNAIASLVRRKKHVSV